MDKAREFAEHPISDWEKVYLRRGKNYRVKTSFVDGDGTQHLVGEEWTFIGSKWDKFDDIYTLGVRFPSGDFKVLPLPTEPEQLHHVIKCFKQYVEEV